MAKRQTKDTYKAAQQQATKSGLQYQGQIGEAGQRAGSYGPGMEDVRGKLLSGMGGMTQIGSDPRDIDTSELKDTLAAYKLFRDTGGLSAENISRMRGMGGFDEFAKTGGYTPVAIANIKAQALSPIGSYATGAREELDRRRALQGGYAPGFDAASRQIQRDAARNIAETSLATNVGLQDRINQGRQWGIGGLTGAEQALAGMQTGNRLAALGGESNVGNMISGYRGQDIANEMNAQMFNAGQQNQGLGALMGLYGMEGGWRQNEYDRMAQLLGGQTQGNLGYLGQRSQLAMQPGWGGNLIQGIGSAAGIGSQFFLPRPKGG